MTKQTQKIINIIGYVCMAIVGVGLLEKIGLISTGLF